MAKITLIGAGSTGFARQFIVDVLTRPALASGTLALMDIDQQNLDLMGAVARKLVGQLGVPTRVETTTDRRRALDGADHVISIVQLFGVDAYDEPMQVARRHGLDQAIGCTTGPGGAFHMLRYMPFMLSLCADMEELCPRAWLLHYANPTSAISWALNIATRIKSVGLCHSVQGTAKEIAGYLGVPYEETGHWVAGINHQAWYLRYEHRGQDMYPRLRERIEDPDVREIDPVRREIMKYFGYFSTESSVHHSDYYPYFRKNPDLIARYTPTRGYWAGVGNGLTNAQRWKAQIRDRGDTLRDAVVSSEPLPVHPSEEYCIGIINAIETNIPYRFNGNVLNTNLITNLPDRSGVEVPCLVDNMGIHPCYIGDLPEACAALNRARMAGDGLLVRGALEGDRRAVEQAIALDPLTGALLTLDQVHAMVEEIFQVQHRYTPQFL
jgi:alpha-galactosidase